MNRLIHCDFAKFIFVNTGQNSAVCRNDLLVIW